MLLSSVLHIENTKIWRNVNFFQQVKDKVQTLSLQSLAKIIHTFLGVKCAQTVLTYA